MKNSKLVNAAAAALVIGSLVTTSAVAQVIEGFLEGPLANVNVTDRTATVNGILACISDQVTISSPTTDLRAMFNDNLTRTLRFGVRGVGPKNANYVTYPNKLPGRKNGGFQGGTCLCATEVDLSGAQCAPGVDSNVTIVDMVLEPAENVVIATMTQVNCTNAECNNPGDEMRIGGTRLYYNADVRIQSEPPGNRGFAVDMTTVAVGTDAAGEGYYSVNDYDPDPLGTDFLDPEKGIHYYVVNVNGGDLVNAGTAEISVERASCRDRGDELEIQARGFTHDPSIGTVNVRNAANGQLLGSDEILLDVDAAAAGQDFGIYDAEIIVDNPILVAAGCPAEFEVEIDGTTATAAIAPDIRID